jgi:ribosomal protein S18 acetylase RimI-like enzyme
MPLVRELFQEYAGWLGVDLCFQGFEEELRSLPAPYQRPSGFIYLARVGEQDAGCIALKPLAEDGVCEMKRLYVREQFRRYGIGRLLVQKCLDEAKAIGYRVMKLDTLSRMAPAIGLYRSFGFEDASAYYHNPIPEVVYMQRAL